jgi:ArsR family transcriptional regulator, arsenate/arsenite/antimonite-responsive transcriptional repressor
MKEFMAIARALADENRTRAVMFLRKGELCVCQIVEMLGLAPSTVSKHLEILSSAGLIESRKDGRWVYYRLPQAPAARAKEALGWLGESLAKDPQIAEDARRARSVMKMDKEGLCCRYKRA